MDNFPSESFMLDFNPSESGLFRNMFDANWLEINLTQSE